mmetsp:Transcript_9253/g.13904  ORF Transcript_9253/g.13904 Transcript_9253/m.13904 type:complete len:284 (-) Transcript_9253:245-1096(-)
MHLTLQMQKILSIMPVKHGLNMLAMKSTLIMIPRPTHFSRSTLMAVLTGTRIARPYSKAVMVQQPRCSRTMRAVLRIFTTMWLKRVALSFRMKWKTFKIVRSALPCVVGYKIVRQMMTTATVPRRMIPIVSIVIQWTIPISVMWIWAEMCARITFLQDTPFLQRRTKATRIVMALPGPVRIRRHRIIGTAAIICFMFPCMITCTLVDMFAMYPDHPCVAVWIKWQWQPVPIVRSWMLLKSTATTSAPVPQVSKPSWWMSRSITMPAKERTASIMTLPPIFRGW